MYCKPHNKKTIDYLLRLFTLRRIRSNSLQWGDSVLTSRSLLSEVDEG